MNSVFETPQPVWLRFHNDILKAESQLKISKIYCENKKNHLSIPHITRKK